MRVDLCDEAVRLARVLAELLPDEPEVLGLLALLLLTDDAEPLARRRRPATSCCSPDQDRSRWDRDEIDGGTALVEVALRRSGGAPGPYALASGDRWRATRPHRRSSETDWPQIATLYAHLEAVQPTAVVRLNRAVAVAEVDGPEAGLLSSTPSPGSSGSNTSTRPAPTCCGASAGIARPPTSTAPRLALTARHPRRFLRRRLAELG